MLTIKELPSAMILFHPIYHLIDLLHKMFELNELFHLHIDYGYEIINEILSHV